MDNRTVALQKHSEWRGKLDIALRAPIENDEDLAIAYTPGVAEPCLEIRKDEDLAYEYTGKGNLVAVITDGTARFWDWGISVKRRNAGNGRKMCAV